MIESRVMPSSAPAESGGDDSPALDDEQVLTGALRDVALRVQEDGLVVARLEGLDLGQAGVDVQAGHLGGRRDHVRVLPLPRRDLRPHAVADALLAEVGAPGPDGDGDVDGARQGVEAHLAVAQVDQRADIAGVDVVDPDGLLGGLDDLLHGERRLDHQHLGRLQEAADVVGQPEDGRSGGGGVGPDALEDSGAVVERVGEDVDLGVVPVDELAVHPNLVHFLN